MTMMMIIALVIIAPLLFNDNQLKSLLNISFRCMYGMNCLVQEEEDAIQWKLFW